MSWGGGASRTRHRGLGGRPDIVAGRDEAQAFGELRRRLGFAREGSEGLRMMASAVFRIPQLYFRSDLSSRFIALARCSKPPSHGLAGCTSGSLTSVTQRAPPEVAQEVRLAVVVKWQAHSVWLSESST